MSPSAQNAGGGRRVTRWTRELIIEKIREWNDRYGEPPCSADWNPSLARWRAQEWRAERYREGVWPSTNAAKRPFEGSFDAAVRAAGLEPHKPGPRRRLPGEARPAVERRDDGWARVPRDVADELLAADERARLAEAHAAALERRLAAAERRADRAEEKVDDARRRARRASEQAGRARRARERTRLTAAETRELTLERAGVGEHGRRSARARLRGPGRGRRPGRLRGPPRDARRGRAGVECGGPGGRGGAARGRDPCRALLGGHDAGVGGDPRGRGARGGGRAALARAGVAGLRRAAAAAARPSWPACARAARPGRRCSRRR